MITSRAWRLIGYTLVGAVLFQLAVRVHLLATTMPAGDLGFSTWPLVHFVSFLAVAVLFVLSFALSGKWKSVRMAVSVVLATFLVTCTLFDSVALVTAPVLKQVVPLSSITNIYCGKSGIGMCVVEFWPIVVGLVLLVLSLGFIIFRAAATIVPDVSPSMLRFDSCTPRALAKLIAGLAALALPLGWLAASPWLLEREPVIRFFTVKDPLIGPMELLWLDRADQPFERSADLKPRPLVLIVVDSLRADSIGLEPGRTSLTPFLRSLHQQGVLHDLGPAIAICPVSYCGIVGIQGSQSWAGLQEGPPLTVGDILAEHGYEPYFFLSGRHQSYFNLGELYGAKARRIADDTDADSSNMMDDREQIERLREANFRNPSKTYLTIHLMSVHTAGLRFTQNETPGNLPKTMIEMIKMDPADYVARHESGVRQMDFVIEQIFELLEQKDMLETALVVITADHGERLQEGKALGHGEPIDLATAEIPLLVYDASGAQWPTRSLNSLIDIAPTLLKAANIPQPHHFAGRPLQDPMDRDYAPMDSVNGASWVGRSTAGLFMVRCEIATGKKEYLLSGQSSRANGSETSAAGASTEAEMPWGESSPFRRKDAEKCAEGPA